MGVRWLNAIVLLLVCMLAACGGQTNGDGRSDSSATGICGDGIVTGPEDCDGTDPVGMTCADLGFDVGVVRCSGHCSYDGAACACTFRSVAAGDDHTCGLKTDGTVACWGDNDYGQAIPPAGTFSQLSVGCEHTCGVKTDGTVACWGADDPFDLGQAAPPSGTFSQVSAGFGHTCGVRTDGTVACWGSRAR